MRRLSLAIACIFLLAPSPGLTLPPAKVGRTTTVSRILESTDFLTAKIALDRVIDPSIQSGEVEREVTKLISAARMLAGPHPSVGAQFDAVRKVLYQPGPWNENRPFAYDQSDPLGEKVRHKLLSEYLKTRLGNCVTMPTLFMIVGRGVGLHLSAPSKELLLSRDVLLPGCFAALRLSGSPHI